MIRSYYEQKSEAWYQERLGRITGTRFKSLFMSPSTKGYQDLVNQVACEIIFGDSENSVFISEDMQNGIDREPDARESYELMFGEKVKEIGFCIPEEDENDYYDYLGCSPDGEVSNGIIEIKCPKITTHLSYISKGGVPKDYDSQVQGNLYITGASFCDFISYHPDAKLYVYREILRDEFIEQVELKLEAFILDVKSVINYYKEYETIEFEEV